MRTMAVEIGRALRRARLARGMTLNALAAASADRFRPTSVAGYERGERKISLVRFCELCRIYEIPPERLLGEILRAVGERWVPEVDLSELEGLGGPEGELVSGFVRQVVVQRGDRDLEAIVLRAGDIQVLASASGRKPEELLEIMRSVRRRDDPPDHDGRSR